jgi:hypothetical protein
MKENVTIAIEVNFRAFQRQTVKWKASQYLTDESQFIILNMFDNESIISSLRDFSRRAIAQVLIKISKKTKRTQRQKVKNETNKLMTTINL